MNVSGKITIFAGAQSELSAAQAQIMQEKADKGNQPQKGSLFAGSLNQDLFSNPILEKKKEAQKKALQVVGDAWESDQKITEDLQERRDLISKLQEENSKAQAEINEISKLQEEIKEEAGIADDSKEQKDLELIRRYNRMLNDQVHGRFSSENMLTEEEITYVNQLKAEGLTDYQTKQLNLDEAKSVFQQTINDNQEIIKEEYAIIRGVRLEKLKSDPMVKAQKEAESIREKAAREIIGMAVEQAKEHIEEKKEEADQKAEKAEEKQERMEEFIEAQKEKRDEAEEILEEIPVEDMVQLDQVKSEVRQEVQKIVDKMALVVEDIKGAMVDEKG